MRLPTSQQKHDSIVSLRAGELVAEGNRVWADGVNGYPQPQLVFGYRPDIIAVNGSRNLISEVETSDTYSSQHTREQLKAFDLAANFLLEVIVPKSVYQAAVSFCNAWSISVDSWRTFQG
jgi:hypothetical protein